MARILVVEDNPQNLKLASVLLQSAGHEVVAAYDANEAEASLADGIPDLILMDLGLPGKDGYSLTRELRARPTTSNVPILAVTSFAMKGDEEKALAAGCSSYLPKPIRASAFLQRIQQLLTLRQFTQGGPAPTGAVVRRPRLRKTHPSRRVVSRARVRRRLPAPRGSSARVPRRALARDRAEVQQ
jgi:two-component system, cell cycle response regulator DivK